MSKFHMMGNTITLLCSKSINAHDAAVHVDASWRFGGLEDGGGK
jgi:hypothetical protein